MLRKKVCALGVLLAVSQAANGCKNGVTVIPPDAGTDDAGSGAEVPLGAGSPADGGWVAEPPPPPGDAAPPPSARGPARKIPTHGSAVAITADDKWAVAVNRTAGRISVFKLDFAGATRAVRTADLDVGAGTEPWAVVIGNDDNTAYVILRRDRKVLRIRNLRGMTTVDAPYANTGSEPTGLAISPTGARLYVANWSDGTISVIDSLGFAVIKVIDLNAPLAASGLLGPNVIGRPALAHPRSIVVTNDGDADDDDERVYVTEFFAQARADALPEDDSRFDVARQGIVYSADVGSGEISLIPIAPVDDTGFPDAKGQPTGCFPNQLYALTINSGRLYVTAVCQSPRGPTGPDPAAIAPGVATSNFKTQVHAAIFVIDLGSNKEIPQQGLLLTRAFDKLFAGLNLPDDGSRRMPLIPSDIMFAAGTTFGYVSGYGSDAVYRIAYKPDGSLDRVGAASQPFINLKPGGTVPAGELPVGIASANTGAAVVSFALAINENSRNLSVLSFGTQTAVEAVSATPLPVPGPDLARNRGKKFFVTGLGRWSLGGQAWNSCESCHPDGLTDNTTWFFARGPRQTTALDASYDPRDPTRRRVLNWTGIFDEIHDFELNTRGNSGGVGAITHRAGAAVANADRIIFDGTPPLGEQLTTPTPQAGLNGAAVSLMPRSPAAPKSVLGDWDDIDEYVKVVRSPRAPSNLVAADVAEGKRLFDANACAGCHGGSHWTLARVFFTPNGENNRPGGLLQTTSYRLPAQFPRALNPPAAAAGTATLRLAGATGATDQINCVLRDVGTFPQSGTVGLAPEGVVVKEVRQDMSTPAQGATGFNIPSLLGLVTGAPYFHAGAARTLEEALGDTFDRHRRAFAENFTPDSDQVRQLVAYLLSIDEDARAPVAPALGFSFDLCAQVPLGAIK